MISHRFRFNWYGDKTKQSIERRVERCLRLIGQGLVNHIKIKLSGGRRGAVGDERSTLGAGEPPHVDTGRLRNSIFYEVSEDGKSVIVGTTVLYGLFLELGAHIRPKNAKMLAIPVSREAQNYSMHASAHGAVMSARDFPKPLIAIKTPHAILLVEANAKGEIKGRTRNTIHYILVGSATIPPHPWLRPSLTEFGTEIEKIFGDAGGAAIETPVEGGE